MKFTHRHILIIIVLAFLGELLSAQSLPESWKFQSSVSYRPVPYLFHGNEGTNGHFYFYTQKGLYEHILELDEMGRYVQVIGPLEYVSPGDGYGRRMIPNQYGGFTLYDNGDNYVNQVRVTAYDANWNQQWQQGLPYTGNLYGFRSITRTSDGGYMLSGSNSGAFHKGRMAKLDSLGVVEWDSSQMAFSPGTGFGESSATRDGHVISIDVYNGLGSTSVQKRDLQGDLIWSLNVPVYATPKLSVDGDGNSWVVCVDPDTVSQMRLMKVDPNGNLLFTKSLSNPTNATFGVEIKSFHRGGGVFATRNYTPDHEQITRFDENGEILWITQVNRFAQTYFKTIDTTSNHGCLVVGNTALQQGQGHLPFAYLIDSLGRIGHNIVSGTAFLDRDGDCVYDSDEYPINNLLVESSNGIDYSYTNDSGLYHISMDSGQHFLDFYHSFLDGEYAPCVPGGVIELNFPGWQDSLFNVDLPIVLDDSCPRMRVQMQSSLYRACLNNNIYVHYENISPDSINNAMVEVSLDPILTFVSASIPHTALGNNVYQFQIPPTLPFDPATFIIEVNTNCSIIVGQAICNVAHIFPDSGCRTPSPNWSGATVAISGECTATDTIHFKIENIGSANMLVPTSFIIVEDDVLRYGGDIRLNAGADTSIYITGNGSTWACFVDQVANHPYNSIPRAFVEGCGLDSSGNFSVGHIVPHQQDDLEHFIDIECNPLRIAYDPNDKTANPFGTLAEHRISSSDQLEYLIRFQNVGNDTAFVVIIRDEISPALDLSTFSMLAASHPYTLQIFPDRTLEWTFDPISLPDSGTNLAESQGYVKFVIQQSPGNLQGTRIENSAHIFFDFNPAIVTNTTWNTIYDSFDSLLVVHLDDGTISKGNPLNVFPNPVKSSVNFRFENYGYPQLVFELYDLNGRRHRKETYFDARQFTMNREELKSGIYLFRITSEGVPLSTGKIIIR